MEVTLKDAAYLTTLLVSVLGIYYRLLYKVEKVETDQNRIYAVVFKKDGTLNLLDTGTCKEHRDLIEKGMQPIAVNIETLSKCVTAMDKKITVLLFHLKINDKDVVNDNVKYG